MAHQLELSNGRIEAAFSLQPAWHGLGTVLTELPDSQTMYAAAGLDWEVGLMPIQMQDGTDIPGKFATYRKDNHKPLGVVGDNYTLVQNWESFAFLDSLLQDGVLRYESAGALKGGRIVWVLARMPSAADEVAPGDSLRRYVLFSTSHDGSKALYAIPTSVRVVCANTLRVATSDMAGIRHTGDMTRKLDYARQYLSQFDAKFTLYRDQARKLATARWATTEEGKAKVAHYIDSLFPPVAEPGRGRTIRQQKVDQIRRNMLNGRNTLGGIAGTWWQAFNAVTEFIDHNAKFRGANSAIRAENRMLSVLDGSGATLKQKAFDLALQLADVN